MALFHTTLHWEDRWTCLITRFISTTRSMMERSSTGVFNASFVAIFFHHTSPLSSPITTPSLVIVQFLWWTQRQTVASGSWWFTVRQYLMGITESALLTPFQSQREPIRMFCWHLCLGYATVNNVLHDTELLFSIMEKGQREKKMSILQYYSQKPRRENILVMLPPSVGSPAEPMFFTFYGISLCVLFTYD